MFTSRSLRGSADRYHRIKATLLGVGLVFLIVGIRLEHDALIWSAIVVLAVAFGARFLPQRHRDEPAEGAADSPDLS